MGIVSTNYHTAIATGAAANASVFNSPLAQLDTAITANATAAAATTAEVVAARAAYPNLDARLTDLILSGGNVATKANGVSAAGQKVLTVDATDGFIVGAYVTYLLNGATLEGNTIASIQAGVSLTLGTNIGTGGVLDDTYISMISTSEYLAAQAIPHAGTLLLPDTMEYANGGVFNVKAYGAVGDGVTDDTTAVGAAIDAAILDTAHLSPVVYFPPGTYSLATFNKTISSRITIAGTDRDQVVLLGPGITSASHSWTFTAGFSFRDLTMKEWLMPIVITPGAGGIDGVYAENVIFDTVKRAFEHGAGTNLISNLRVHKCEVKDSKYGFRLLGRVSDAWFTENYIHDLEDTTSCGIRVGDGTWTSYADDGCIVVSGNVIDTITATGLASVETQAILIQARDVQCTGNIVRNITSAGTEDCEGIYIDANRASVNDNVLYLAGGLGNGSITVKPGTNGENIVISGNTIYHTLATLAGIYCSSGNASITGNTIEVAGQGITVAGADGKITISDNTIISDGSEGVRISDAGNFAITGNVITTLNTTTEFAVKLDDAGANGPGIINGNTISASGGGIRLESIATGITITGNHIEYASTNASYRGIETGTGVTSVVISNNHIVALAAATVTGLYIASDCTIVGNRFVVAGQITVLLWLIPAKTARVSENEFSLTSTGIVSRGVYCLAASVLQVENNVFDGYDTDNEIDKCIDLVQAITTVQIHGNVFLTNVNYAVDVTTVGTNISVQGNAWHGDAAFFKTAYPSAFTSAIVRNNLGLITEATGTGTVASGATTAVITHGLSVTPNLQDITVIPTNNLGNATKFWITTPTSTQFTINVDADPGAGTATFVWKAGTVSKP